jgi:hypothetical protein
VAPPADIERLITLGLNRYGAGDIDGALLMWEEALAIDPDNAQANSYVNYVQANYGTLSRGEHEVTKGDESPFAIEEEPEYQIEIVPGELVHLESTPMSLDRPNDEGFFDDESTHAQRRLDETVESIEPESLEPESLELEADEPPLPEISFEDATREYHGTPQKQPEPPPQPQAHNEFDDGDFSETAGTAEYVPEQFQPEGTPVGFSFQDTEIRKRDLGFVQPTAAKTTDAPADKPSLAHAPTIDSISLAEQLGASDQAHIETQDIPIVSPKAITQEMPDGGRLPNTKAVTKELPDSRRPPARRDTSDLSQAEVVLTHSPTQDFDQPKIDIGAPTRELGIRPRSLVAEGPVDDDTPTNYNIRPLRDTRDTRAESMDESTKSDRVLPFDPIDARAAQILEEIDAGAAANESQDDRTRRRINTLLERAVAWNQSGDTERAVCAVDLAISEDPNSALGQKLITRNRDTIMSVFQGYLGDLDRQPQLAKPLHELASAPISPRAAFLLSRIDGTLTVDELLDVSGMPRLEAYRHICQLFLRGILR